MRKIFLLLSVMIAGIVGLNAQLLKTDFLSGYAVGDNLEKNEYTTGGTSTEPFVFNTWSCSRGENNAASPVAVAPLTYDGYVNSGEGVGASMLNTGSRSTVYTIPSLSKGTYYLAALFNPTAFRYGGHVADFFSFDIDGKGVGLRTRIAIKRGSAVGKVIFGLNQKNADADIVWEDTEYDVDKTYLLVIKATVGATGISLYINPVKSSTEPTADITATLTDPLAKPRGIVIRQKKSTYEGVISGIALTSDWNTLWK